MIEAELISPGFALLPPDVVHGARMPPEARRILGPIWHRLWFAERRVRVRRLQDVFVAQEGLVLRADGAVVPETVQQHTPEQVAAAQAAISGATPRLDGTVLLGRKPGAWNYGHFIVEMLPRILIGRRRCGADGRVLVQAVPDPLRRVMHDALALAGFQPAQIIAAGPDPVRVDQLVLVEGLSDHGQYLSPLTLPALDAATIGIAPTAGANLFVIRPGLPRRLADEAAVAEAAAVAGYRVIDPAAMAFAEQVAAFRAARRIVGVMGAGLASIAFAAPGAELFVLAPAGMVDSFYWLLAGLRGLALREIRCAPAGGRTGPHPWDSDLALDTADLQRLLDPARLPARPSADVVAADLRARFDGVHYLRRNPDVAAAGVDPLTHFLDTGWREGRDPAAGLRLAGDGDVNPLVRAVLRDHGIAEIWP
jgi:capsular polysaccharide biosynthesis protein